MDTDEPVTLDEARRIIAERDRRIMELEREKSKLERVTSKLERKVDELEQKLARATSLTKESPATAASGIPTSKILFRATRKTATPRKRGPPIGHQGITRPAPLRIDRTTEAMPSSCPDCNGKLRAPTLYRQRVVTQIVPAHIEHVAVDIYRAWCPRCKHRVTGTSPEMLPNTPFGPSVVTLVVFLRMQGLPLGKIRAILKEAYGLELCESSVLELERIGATAVGPEYEEARRAARMAPVAGGDETSWRIGGENWWLWAATGAFGSCFLVSPSRGRQAALELFGANFGGILVRDGWRAYEKVAVAAQHCLVHLNRELQKIEVRYRVVPRGLLDPSPPEYVTAGRPPRRLLVFVDSVREVLRRAVRWVERTPKSSAKLRTTMARRYEKEILAIASIRRGNPHAQRVSKTLRRVAKWLFAFVKDPTVPYHNNATEKAIRQAVVHRKISGGRTTEEGGHVFAKLLTVFETARARKESFMKVLASALGRLSSGRLPGPSSVART